MYSRIVLSLSGGAIFKAEIGPICNFLEGMEAAEHTLAATAYMYEVLLPRLGLITLYFCTFDLHECCFVRAFALWCYRTSF